MSYDTWGGSWGTTWALSWTRGDPVPPAPPNEDQPSNWQANYWRNKSKADRENEAMLERIRLGILPPLAREEALDAVVAADHASRELAAGRIDAAAGLLAAMEAREAYENVYRAAHKEAYIAEVVAENFRQDMKRITRRRKAIALLLH